MEKGSGRMVFQRKQCSSQMEQHAQRLWVLFEDPHAILCSWKHNAYLELNEEERR